MARIKVYSSIIIFGFLLLISACDAVIGEPVLEIPGLAQTLAVQTIMADEQLSQLLNSPTPIQQSTTSTIAASLGLGTPTPSEFPGEPESPQTHLPPTSTALPTLTPDISLVQDFPENATPLDPDAPCNAAEYIRDVTIPDDSIVKPNSKFTKVWAIRNVGTCVWKKGEYALVLFWGHDMGTEPPVPLEFDVAPGQTAELAVDMVAPVIPACWQGNWMLQDNEGNRFGIGPNYKNYFWVSVTVWWPNLPKIVGG